MSADRQKIHSALCHDSNDSGIEESKISPSQVVPREAATFPAPKMKLELTFGISILSSSGAMLSRTFGFCSYHTFVVGMARRCQIEDPGAQC